MDPLAEYGPIGGLIALALVLAQAVITRKNGKPDDERDDFRREMRDHVKDIRRNVHSIRDTMQTVVSKVAVLERDVDDLRERR